ncbi:monovalent cation/H+ antiporter subunit D [Thiofilum flexile]|uniref:monovalent cation/H+ antiporter subunit D n=1 Tax=Thiofilum flexile TaxID=125627 RepID=UPI00037B4ECD|nr:monovalent cation/H+ antiporter subunit D [Thiofilum flexile]
MNYLPIWAILFPLLGGLLQLLIRNKAGVAAQRGLSLILLSGLVLLALWMFIVALQGERYVYYLGNWPAPFGIVLVLDQLSAMMVLLTAVLALMAMSYAMLRQIDQLGLHFHVLFQIQLFGLNGAFLTGDIFNLFVFFEVLLLASYGLMLHGLGQERTKAGLHYVTLNLVGSILFLFALGAVYGSLGTLNLADLALKVGQAPLERQGLIKTAGLLLLVVFGLKAAMFPLYMWLPATYASTSAPVAALFAIMTKVGIYALIRVHGTMFGAEAQGLAYFYQPWVLSAGLVTLFVAALGVVAAQELRRLVTYGVLASVATLLIAVGINTPASLAAALFYLVHSTLLAATFFLLADLISEGREDIGDRLEKAPIMPGAKYLGIVYFAVVVGMVGLPPLSGFLGKALILQSALAHPWYGWIFAVVLGSSLIMLVSMVRAGTLLFYRLPPRDGRAIIPLQKTALLPIYALLFISPLLVLLAHPITEFTQQMAQQLLDLSHYTQAVLANPMQGGH